MFRADHLWWAAATGFVGILLVTLCVSTFDQRLIGNEAAWVKPIKFQSSLALHFATLAAIAGLLSEQQRTGSVLVWTAVRPPCGVPIVRFRTMPSSIFPSDRPYSRSLTS